MEEVKARTHITRERFGLWRPNAILAYTNSDLSFPFQISNHTTQQNQETSLYHIWNLCLLICDKNAFDKTFGRSKSGLL